MPALLVDGRAVYDDELTALVDEAGSGREDAGPASRRRAEVEAWSRFAYVTGLKDGADLPPAVTEPAPAEAVAVAPGAWRIPACSRAEGQLSCAIPVSPV